ncbi:MAG: hypothetical protein KGI75_16345, partial [Rhizobiaceae bacterium]|nr:hypothetical protein [Rhizobiaceae bacterium]
DPPARSPGGFLFEGGTVRSKGRVGGIDGYARSKNSRCLATGYIALIGRQQPNSRNLRASLDIRHAKHDISAMTEIQPPSVGEEHPDRHTWCQFAMHAAFAELAKRALNAGWREREVAATLVDLADRHMIDLITVEEMDAILGDILKER